MAVEKAGVTKFGFKSENIRKLTNGEATRQRILEVLGDELTDGRKVHREDRVFFFFAGTVATRTFDDGRQLGFIVPVDAGQSNYYSTAISMTSLREASDLIPAKHVYFVMDSALQSGPGASPREAGAYSKDKGHLDEITRRVRAADPHRGRRRPAGIGRRPGRALRLHTGTARRARRQGRPRRQQRNHGIGAGFSISARLSRSSRNRRRAWETW